MTHQERSEMTLKKQALVFGAIAIVGLFGCEKKAKLDSDQEKASYAIGQQIGKSLKMQNADVVVPSLVAGMNDAIEGKDAKLKPEDMQKALQTMQEAAMKKAMEAAQVNEKKGEEFLAANKSKPGWKETASGLQYSVVAEGSGESPKDTDTVKVHYTGTLITGEKFDSSRDRNEPAEFPVNGVIPGWTEALKLMKKGAHYNLAIPSKLAYGPQGRPGIPPNSTLLFDVELLDIKAAPAAAAAHGGKKK
jgi:FKBP-type peptidyl-prolyl cis-trans isomerase FkpA/FKBP-type peptidyl-prolyl cis-trans isomerase FklB